MKKTSREKTTPVQEKDLSWAKGGSGWIFGSGYQEPPPPPPDDPQ